MHIHVPKPIHGWRQFFNEVAVIVVGIAIALSGEEMLGDWHEERQAEKSLAAVEDELAVNLGRMESRLRSADCVDRRLDQIAAYLDSSTPQQRPSWIGRPQVWSMQTSAVDAARAYGSLTVMPRATQMAISTVYGSMAGFADTQKDEQWAWAELRALADDRDLSDSDKSDIRSALQRARYAAWRIRADATQAAVEARPLHITPDKVTDGSQSACIAMDTPFGDAERQSSASGFPEPR